MDELNYTDERDIRELISPRERLKDFIDRRSHLMEIAKPMIIAYQKTKFKNTATCIGALRSLLTSRYPDAEFHIKIDNDQIIRVWRLS